MSKINREWHAEHRMPERATPDERIAWHLAHSQHCRCRPIPHGVRLLMAARGIPVPDTQQED